MNDSLIPRPRLLASLDRVLQYKLVLVQAPAGYGKTTAVAQWLAARKHGACWLALGAGDSEPACFCRLFSQALDDMGLGAGSLLRDFRPGRRLARPDALAALFARRLAVQSGQVVMVFDNYHYVDQQKYINDFFAGLLNLPTEQLQLIVISRSELPEQFFRYPLHGKTVQLRTDDLRFSAKEIDEFFRRKNIIIPKDELPNIEQTTEGWIKGLQLGVAEATGSEGGNKVSFEDNPYIEDYFNTEVYAKMPAVCREIMPYTAVFTKMHPGLCAEAITPCRDTDFLACLHRKGAFLVALDASNQWFRYHNLFRKFLQKKLAGVGEEALNDLQKRAGGWFESNNHLAEAVEHLLQAKAYQELAGPIIKYAKEKLKSGEPHKLLPCLEALPAAMIDNNPLLMLVYTWATLMTGDVSRYLFWLEKLEAFDYSRADCPADLVVKIKNDLSISRSLKAALLCDIEESIRLGREVRSGGFFMQEGIDFNHGEAGLMPSRVKLPLEAVIHYALAMNAIWPRISKQNGAWTVVLGELFYEIDELESAMNVLSAGISEAEQAKTNSILVAGNIAMSRVARARGNLEGAWRIVARAEDKVKQDGALEWLRPLEAFKVQLWIDGNDTQSLADWLTKMEFAGGFYRPLPEYEELSLARALQFAGRFHDASRILQYSIARARVLNRVPSLVVLNVLQAISRYCLNDDKGALLSLGEALSVARRDGYLRSIADEGRPLIKVLQFYRATACLQGDGGLSEYVEKLLRLTRNGVNKLKSSGGCLPGSKAVTRLTLREAEVLRLLADGQTNLEIADVIGVTVNTVKRHLHSMYYKLGVKSRTQAIKRGREQQLI